MSIQFLNDLILFFCILHDIMIEKNGSVSGLLILFLKNTIFKIVYNVISLMFTVHISLYKYNNIYTWNKNVFNYYLNSLMKIKSKQKLCCIYVLIVNPALSIDIIKCIVRFHKRNIMSFTRVVSINAVNVSSVEVDLHVLSSISILLYAIEVCGFRHNRMYLLRHNGVVCM